VDSKALRGTSRVHEAYLGEDIYERAVADENIYVWQRGPIVYASLRKQAIKGLIETRRMQQRTYKTDDLNASKPLRYNDNYRQSFSTLSDSVLARFYTDFSAGSQRFGSVYADAVPFLNVLGADALTLFSKGDNNAKALAFEIDLAENSLNITTVRVSSGLSTKPSRLSASIPSTIKGWKPDFFFEFPVNEGSIVFDHLKTQYGIDVPSAVSYKAGNIAILGGLKQNGQPVLLLAAEYEGKSQAVVDAVSLTKALAPISKEAHGIVSGDYILVGTSVEDVKAFEASILEGGETMAMIVLPSQRQNIHALYSTRTEGLMKFMQYYIASRVGTVNVNADIWNALSTFSRSIPSLLIRSEYKDGVLRTHGTVAVASLGVAEKNQAEKVLQRLQTIEMAPRTTAAARDSGRLADIVIVKSAIESYVKSEGRAPNSLEELVPLYLQAVPRDPLSQTVYSYANTRNDATFYFLLQLETTTSFGDAGVYCVTSAGTKIASGQNCKEE
jgi:hypothetical protein